MRKILSGVAALVLASPAAAWPVLSDCGWQASAEYLAEPWYENTVTFSNGATRIALIDTLEPAAGAFGLLILSPPYGPTGERHCKVLHGFSGLSLQGLASAYDPSIGLQLSMTGQVYLEDEAQFTSAQVDLVLNQATGDIEFNVTPYTE